MKKIRGIKRSMSRMFDEAGVATVYTVVVLDSWPDFEIEVGDRVKVRGVSKGRGFSGVMKRHGFSGGPATHGQSDRKRAPGSIGQQTPGRVFKGKKMPGRYGGTVCTVTGLKILDAKREKKYLKVKGALPGHLKSKVTLSFYDK